MAINKEMLERLKLSLNESNNFISAFGVDLKLNYYDKGVFNQDEIRTPECKVNNNIKLLTVLKNSLNKTPQNKIAQMNHNKKIQRTRKARR